MRALSYLRRLRNYSKRFGIKAAVQRSVQYIADRVGPPGIRTVLPDRHPLGHGESARGCRAHCRYAGDERAWMASPRPPRQVLWVMPDFLSVHNGGPNTILRFAHYFARRGAESIVYIYNGHVHQSSDQVRMEIFRVFGAEPRLKVVLNPYHKPLRPDDFPESDMAVATLWNTAFILLQYHRTKSKLYLVQDYETQFYPGSIEASLADLTYDFGFLAFSTHRVCATL